MKEEVAQNLGSRLAVRDLGMELDAVALSSLVFERGDRRVVRARGDAESRRRRKDAVAMTGPDALMRRRVGKKRRVGDDVDLRPSIFALARRFHTPVEEKGG